MFAECVIALHCFSRDEDWKTFLKSPKKLTTNKKSTLVNNHLRSYASITLYNFRRGGAGKDLAHDSVKYL